MEEVEALGAIELKQLYEVIEEQLFAERRRARKLKTKEEAPVYENLIHHAFHRDSDSSVWRDVSPCLHGGGCCGCDKKKCPLKENCGFQTLVTALKAPTDWTRRVFVMKGFTEQERTIEKWHSSRPYPIPKEMAPRDLFVQANKRVELRKEQDLVYKMPLDEFLEKNKLALRKERCLISECSDRDCDRVHRVTQLFVQFDHPLLIGYYSYHLKRQVEPLVRNGSIFHCANECIHCRGKLYLSHPYLMTHSLDGILMDPLVKFQCRECSNITAFVIYQ